jgi:hypothetical protein
LVVDADLRELERAAHAAPGDHPARLAFATALERQGHAREARWEWGRLAELGLEEAWKRLEPRRGAGLLQAPKTTRTELLPGRFYFRGRLGSGLLAGRWGEGDHVTGVVDPQTLQFHWSAPGRKIFTGCGPDLIVRADADSLDALEWVCADTGEVLARSPLQRPPQGGLSWVPEDPPKPERLWVEADRIVVALKVGSFYAYQTFQASKLGAAPLYVSPVVVNLHLDHLGGGHVIRWDTNWSGSETGRYVVAESVEDGNPTWTSDAKASALIADHRGALLVEEDDKQGKVIFEVDPRSGARRWSTKQTLHPAWIRPSPELWLAKTNFMQTHADGNGSSSCFDVTANDRSTGALRWSWRCPDVGITCTGFELGAKAVYIAWTAPLFGIKKARLTALELDTGRELYSHYLELRHTSPGSMSSIGLVPLDDALLLCSGDHYAKHGGSLVEWLEV